MAVVAVGILVVSGIFRLNGYNEMKHEAYYSWNPFGVFVREWGFFLFLLPVFWLVWMLVARVKFSRNANRIGMLAGWSLLAVLLVLFVLYPSTAPFKRGFLIIP